MGNRSSHPYRPVHPDWYDAEAERGQLINPDPDEEGPAPRGQTLTDAEERRWSGFPSEQTSITADRERRLVEKERREIDRREREAHATKERQKRRKERKEREARRKMEQRARREEERRRASAPPTYSVHWVGRDTRTYRLKEERQPDGSLRSRWAPVDAYGAGMRQRRL